jgi:hypothetical protein
MLKSDTKKVSKETKADTIKTDALNVILWNKEVLLWKERLNSDDHHFHQYQQNKQLPFILTELTEHKKRPWHMMLEIQVLVWDSHKNVVGFNQLMWSNIWWSKTNTMYPNQSEVNDHLYTQLSPIS